MVGGFVVFRRVDLAVLHTDGLGLQVLQAAQRLGTVKGACPGVVSAQAHQLLLGERLQKSRLSTRQ